MNAAPAQQPLAVLEVVSNPRGGYSHAEPVNPQRSTGRIYRGWWSTKRKAKAALPST